MFSVFVALWLSVPVNYFSAYINVKVVCGEWLLIPSEIKQMVI